MRIKTTLIALFLGVFTFAFTTTEEVVYKVDKQQSSINWVGRKVTGEHSGTINFVDGNLQWNGNKLSGGSFEIDMASLANTDLTDEKYNQQLVGHLKSDDFFSTEKHPKAKFLITNVKPLAKNQSQITGKLTIKGITNEVQFPATIQASGNQLTAKAKIVVDRTKFDIKYGSDSFFDKLGDKAIDNEFDLNVTLVATK